MNKNCFSTNGFFSKERVVKESFPGKLRLTVTKFETIGEMS